jgi:hypothetical protein
MAIYKYLTDKLDDSHGQIQQMAVIAVEMCRERATKEGVFAEWCEVAKKETAVKQCT